MTRLWLIESHATYRGCFGVWGLKTCYGREFSTEGLPKIIAILFCLMLAQAMGLFFGLVVIFSHNTFLCEVRSFSCEVYDSRCEVESSSCEV